MSIVEPHIITVSDLIRFARFGTIQPKVDVDADDGSTTYGTTVTGVTDTVLEQLRQVVVGVESEFERITKKSFGELTHHEVLGKLDLDPDFDVGIPFALMYNKTQEIDTAQGDYLEWRSIYADKWDTIDPSYYWIDTLNGIVYFKKFPLYGRQGVMVRCKYRYGIMEGYEDVKYAIKKKAYVDMYNGVGAVNITTFQQNNFLIPTQVTMQAYQEDFEKCANRWRGLTFIR